MQNVPYGIPIKGTKCPQTKDKHTNKSKRIIKKALKINFAAKIACRINMHEYSYIICKISTMNIAWKVFYI